MDDFLTAKFHAYGFYMKSFESMHIHLDSRKQTVKINSKDNSYDVTLFGIQQRFCTGTSVFQDFNA